MNPTSPNAPHFFKSVIDNLAEGVIVADESGRFLVFNRAAEKILGKGALDVHPLEWAAAYGCYRSDKTTPYSPDHLPLARAIRGEEVFEETIYLKNPDTPPGAWISVSGRPLKSDSGSTAGGFVILHDISRREIAKERLNSISRRLSTLVENQRTAILIENQQREIQYINKVFCHLFGIPLEPSELIGTDCSQSAQQAKHLFCEPEGFVSRIRDLLASSSPITNEKITLCDGRVFERDFIPVMSESDHLGYVWQYRDITHSERTLDNLKLIERLSQALAQTTDSVVITDRQGRIEYVNQAFEDTTGFSAAEALGQTPRLLKSGVHNDEVYRGLWNKVLSGQNFRGTLANRKKTGEVYWAEQTITPVKDDAGNVTHFVSVLKDITELLKRKEREVELRLARDVQQSFYRECASVPGFDIAAKTDPADETGGDYYDFIHRPDGNLCIVVGDVCGHGMSSALIMAETRAFVRSLASTVEDPGETLTLVNRMLHEDLDQGRFVTILLICLDPRSKTLMYAGAGHEFGYLLGRSGDVEHVLQSTGPPLGPFLDSRYSSSETLVMKEGDILLMLTDGVTESFRDTGRESLTGRALAYVQARRHEPACEIASGLCSMSRSRSQGRVSHDDATSIIVKAL